MYIEHPQYGNFTDFKLRYEFNTQWEKSSYF